MTPDFLVYRTNYGVSEPASKLKMFKNQANQKGRQQAPFVLVGNTVSVVVAQ